MQRSSPSPSIETAALLPKDLYARSHAVVIGIDRYDHADDLEGAERDAQRVTAQLKRRGFTVTQLLGNDASGQNIRAALAEELPTIAGERDRVFVYFAGHGVSQLRGRSRNGYLLPSSADPKRPTSTGGLSMTEIVDWFRDYEAKQVMFVADACYSGLTLRSRSGSDRGIESHRIYSHHAYQKALVILVAGRDNQKALEWKNKGLMTQVFLDGLDGAADIDGDSVVTSSDLLTYVKGEVPRIALQEFNILQNPQGGITGPGEILFSTGRVPTVPEESTLEELPPTGTVPEDSGPTLSGEPDLSIPAMAPLKSWDAGAESLRKDLENVARKQPRDVEGVRKAACALAEYSGSNPHATFAETTCTQWTRYHQTLKSKDEQLAHQYSRLMAYLGQSHLTQRQRTAALSDFLDMFEGMEHQYLARARVALERLREGAHQSTVVSLLRPGWIRVAPGHFMMGTAKTHAPRDRDEVHVAVEIRQPFMMQNAEVTQGQWARLMGTYPSEFSECGTDCPVERVTFYDALAYANRRSHSEGLPTCYTLTGCQGQPGVDYTCTRARFSGTQCSGYRLPTEEEWEYVARAGSTADTYAGDLQTDSKGRSSVLEDIAWYNGNSVFSAEGHLCPDWGQDGTQSGGCGPRPVRTKTPNAFGAYDMLGNVWEWVWSRSNPQRGTYETGGAASTTRAVSRGGGWYNDARDCRSANRFITRPGSTFFNLGFRLVRTLSGDDSRERAISPRVE